MALIDALKTYIHIHLHIHTFTHSKLKTDQFLYEDFMHHITTKNGFCLQIGLAGLHPPVTKQYNLVPVTGQ